VSETLEIIIKAKDAASGAIKKTAGAVGDMSGKMKGAGPAANKLSVNLKKIGTAAATTSTKLKGISGKLLNLKTGFAAVAAGVIAKGLLNTATSFENYETSLTTITGSAEKAKKSMDWIKEFTAKTPFELDQVTGGFVKLSSYGLNATKLMGVLGDTAAGMGKPLNQAVEAMADAVTGEFERLKEFGIKAKTQGDKVTFSWMQNGVTMSKTTEKVGASIQDALSGILSGRFEGAMDRYSKTWSGMWSNLMDSFNLFKQAIMEAGVFDYVKEVLSGILDKIKELRESGKLQEWAKKISDAIITMLGMLKTVGSMLMTAAGFFLNLYNAMGPIAPVITGIMLAAALLLPVFGMIGFAISGLITGFGAISTALAGIAGTLGGTLLTALGVALAAVVAFFGGWKIGKLISASDAFGLLPITVGEAVQVAYSYLDAFFTRVKIGYLGIKKAIKDAFGFDTSAIDAQIDAENRHLDVVHKVRDQILAGKAEETAAHQQSKTEIDQKTTAVQSFKDKLAQPAEVKVDFTKAELDAMTFDQRFKAYKRMYSEPVRVGIDTMDSNAKLEKLKQDFLKAKDAIDVEVVQFGLDTASADAKLEKLYLEYKKAEYDILSADKYGLDTAPASASLDRLSQKGIRTKGDFDAFIGAFAPAATQAGAEFEEGVGSGLAGAAQKMTVWVDGVEVDMSSIAEHGVYGMTSIGESAQKMGETGKTAAEGMKSALDEATKDRNMKIEAALKGVDSIKAQIAALTRPETKVITVVTKQVVQKAAGGIVRAFAAGGKLAGYGGGDKIRALLEAGEFVIRKEAVRKYGAAMFNAFNAMAIPQVPQLAFAAGGAVPEVNTGGQSVSLSIPINISATGSDAGNMERMFRNSIIPQLKEALANNTKSITTTFKKHVG